MVQTRLPAEAIASMVSSMLFLLCLGLLLLTPLLTLECVFLPGEACSDHRESSVSVYPILQDSKDVPQVLRYQTLLY